MVVGLELLSLKMNLEVLVVVVTLHVALIATALVTLEILVTTYIAVLLGDEMLWIRKRISV